jgi:hypothetical protein
MLEVGQRKGSVTSAFVGSGDTGMTADEEINHFGMWCIMSSPPVLGCDVRRISPETLDLVTNPYLLRMNQDRLGIQAEVVARDGEAYMLAKDAQTRFGTSRYVALYNASDEEHEFRVDAATFDLGGTVEVFDLVKRSEAGAFTGAMTVRVAPHASKFYLFDAERRLERRVYEAECAYLTDYSELDGTSYGSEKSCRKQGRAYPTAIAAASGGVAVVNLGGRERNDLVWKNVRVSSGGKRKVVFRCSGKKDASFFVQVGGGEKRRVDVTAQIGEFVEAGCELEFKAGVQEVRLSNAAAMMPDVDVMYIR